MKSNKAKNLAKEFSAARDKSLPKPSPNNSTLKDKDIAKVTTGDKHRMTTNQGQPISTDQYSLRGGHRGPTPMEDQVLREKIQHFDHERIPERVVHARGAAAHGFFQV
jgi:catalase